MMAHQRTSQQDKWIFDTGASRHMTNNLELFLTYKEYPQPEIIHLATDALAPSLGEGTISLTMKVLNKEVKCSVKDVIYVPSLKNNLFALGPVMFSHTLVHSGSDLFLHCNQKQIPVAHAVWKSTLFELQVIPPPSASLSTVEPSPVAALWHRRFGHLSASSLKYLIQQKMTLPIPDLAKDSCIIPECHDCRLANIVKSTHPSLSQRRSQRPLEVVHSDVFGPVRPASQQGKTYFVSFIDDYTRFAWIYLLRHKSEVFSAFKHFKSLAETQSGQKIQTLLSDRGGEYLSKEFDTLLTDLGIQHSFSAARTPQQNGVAERFNRTIVEKARVMLHEAKLPLSFWAEAIMTANYLRNRSPTKAMAAMTPYQAWTGKLPSVKHLRVFGCQAFYLKNPAHVASKFDSKGRSAIILGYDSMDNYRLFDLQSRTIVITKDATFIESELPGLGDPVIENSDSVETDFGVDLRFLLHPATATSPPTVSLPVPASDVPPEVPAAPVPLRRSRRLQNLPPISPVTASFCALSMEDSSFISDPKSIKEAYSRPDAHLWKQAVKDQLDSLEENQTWELVPLPPGKRCIIPLWVFTVKRNGHGEIVKYKARCVANGKTQQFGVDYFDTFSPVVKLTSIRVLLAWASTSGYLLWHFDIKSAYLYGNLSEEVYMKPPPGYDCPPNLVCRLKKSIYGLKQAARTWNTLLNDTLIQYGFQRLHSDTGIYRRLLNGKYIYLAIWVDDILLLCPDESAVSIVHDELQKHFQLTDLGPVTFLLGMNIIRHEKQIYLNQHFYLKRLLESTGMADCNSFRSETLSLQADLRLLDVRHGRNSPRPCIRGHRS
jgi:transposase InsO family protein